jgi:hypothetical protein
MKRFLPIAIVSMLLLAACAEDGNDAAGPTTDTGGTGSTAVTGPTSPTGTGSTGSTGVPTGSLEAELEDGEHFGFVDSVNAEGETMVFDLAYFLTGEEANDAAAERGLEVPVPNDYFIVNDNPKLRTLALSPDLELALLDWNHCCDEFFAGDLATFETAINTGEQMTVGDDVYLGALSQYWVTVEDGVVVRIEEQYLP